MRQTGISFLICFCLQGILLFSLFAQQNVGIGTASPHPSAKLEVQSANQGLLIPRLTVQERNSIASPAKGLQVYNTTDNSLDFFDGTSWLRSFGIKETGQGEISDGWTSRSPMLNNRRNGAAFAIGNKIYLGAGDTASNQISNEFTEYDVLLNTWRRLPNSNLPDGSRRYPFSFSVGQKGYVGGGISMGGGGFTGSLWEFDPVSELWTAKASFPEQLIGSIAAVVNGKAYVGLGSPASGTLYSNTWYEYDPATNVWTAKAPFPGQGRWQTHAMVINNKIFVIGGEAPGSVRLKDVWEYDPATNTWQQKNDFLGNARAGGVCFTLNNRGFLGYGVGTGTNDFFEYNPQFDTWSPRSLIPGVTAAFSFRGVAISQGAGFVFGGFGNNLTTYRYQPAVSAPIFTPGGPTASAYINNGIWGKVGETVYSLNSGNVGIGTTNPQAMLDVAGDLRASTYRLSAGAASGKMLVAADAAGTFGWQDQPWLVSGSNAIKNTGFVGIGEANPTSPLYVSGTLYPLHVNGAVAGATNIRMTNTSLGTATWDITMTGAAATTIAPGSLSFKHSSQNDAALTIATNRLVGIGTTQPVAPLHVAGTSANTSATAMRYFNFSSVGITAEPAWPGGTTIYAEGNVCATQAFISAQSFNFSDARIKQIVGLTNNQQDLERLSKIEVTRYRYIDTMANGTAVQTKVIAQQLKKVMPEAVSYRSQFLPSIMQLATTSGYNVATGELTITVPKLQQALEFNVPIKCYAENGMELLYTLVAAQGQTMVLKGPAAMGRLFVYGHEVKDFHVVDYDAIGMLNVSATQALLKRIEELEDIVKKLKR